MSLTHGDHDLDEMEETRRDREITLGMSTMLGIFFALTLVVAGFFGFGYALGRKSATASAAATDASTGDDSFRTFKPSPGAPAIQPAPGFSSKEAAAANAAATNTTYAAPAPPPPTRPAATAILNPATKPTVAPVAGSLAMTAAVPKTKVDPDATVVGDNTPPKSAPAPVVRPTPPPAAGGNMVQVSAFTRQEDADVVVSALKRKGYNVFIRHEPQDNFLHVQLGPYPTRKEAEAMRDKLSSDGFNAMVK